MEFLCHGCGKIFERDGRTKEIKSLVDKNILFEYCSNTNTFVFCKRVGV